jgi:hypothetical protein
MKTEILDIRFYPIREKLCFASLASLLETRRVTNNMLLVEVTLTYVQKLDEEISPDDLGFICFFMNKIIYKIS